MKMPSRRSLAIAISLASMVAVAAPAWAQAQDYGVGRQSMRDKREAARAAKKADQPEVVQQYPLATREEPEERASRKGVKKLQAMQETFQAGDAAATLAAARAIYEDPDSNAYEKAFAYQVAGNAAANEGDTATAVDMFTRALEANGLDNNNHYTVMFNLAVTQYGQDKFAEALQTLDRFIAETKADKPEVYSLRGGLLMSLERYADAAALYAEQMAKHPDDRTLRMNAVAAYQANDQMDEAAELLAAAQARGQLTDPNEYRALYVTYINADRDKDAIAVIEQGLASGVLQPSPQLAKDFMVLGQKAYFASDDATAVEMYTRAASMAADGEASLNLAKIHAENGRKAEAKAAAQAALDKGVKDADDARKLLGGG